mmetsp:Transcript_7663/g.10580  ORF Transcript_7663/g.10580 Transcript_7663/m.10580 type:complete len:745 (-) Transcript_7663:71-2305(-)
MFEAKEKGFAVGPYYCKGRENLIGTGSFAEVYLGFNTQTNEKVAIKVVDVKRLTKGNQKLTQYLGSEIQIMKGLDHENIVRLYDVFFPSESHIYMVFEFCAGGDLAGYLKKTGALPEPRVKRFMKQLASALKFLRSKNIIHRDLKPQNLLLTSRDENAVLKIADFGFARFIDSQSTADTLCGSPLYMAPEILKMQSYTVKADLWSVGAILFEMLIGHAPYPVKSHIELLRAVDNKNVEIPEVAKANLSPEVIHLLQSLLQRDPISRISWDEFFMHPWLLDDLTSSPAQNYPSAPMNIRTSGQEYGGSGSYQSGGNYPGMPVGSFPRSGPNSRSNSFTNLQQGAPIPGSEPPLSSSPYSRTLGTTPNQQFYNPSQPAFVGSPPVNQFTFNKGTSPQQDQPFAPMQFLHNSPPNPIYSSSQGSQNQFYGPSGRQRTSTINAQTAQTASPPMPDILATRGRANTAPIPVQQGAFEIQTGFNVASPPARNFTHQSPPNMYSQSFSPRGSSGSLHHGSAVTNSPPSSFNIQNAFKFGQNPFPLNPSQFQEDILGEDPLFVPDSVDPEEIRVLTNLETKAKRALAIASLGDLKVDNGLLTDGFVLYIKSLFILQNVLSKAKKMLSAPYSPGPEVAPYITAFSKYRDRYAEYLRKCELVKQNLRPADRATPAEKIIYDFIMHSGREGVVQESLTNYDKAAQEYEHGIVLLGQLLSDAKTDSDKETLEYYLNMFTHRLGQVKSQKLRQSNTT